MALRMNRTFIQKICPSPARYVQDLIIAAGMTTGLDIGCGQRSLLTELRGPGFKSTGIDASSDMLEQARRNNAHDHYICGNVVGLADDMKYDVVVLSEVIEHLTREDGEKLLDKVDSLALRLIYVETPNGFLEQPPLDGNPYQEHLSGWTSDDFRRRGYEVYGIGIKGLRGPVGRAFLGMETVVRTIERLTRYYVFMRPEKAFALGAVKRK